MINNYNTYFGQYRAEVVDQVDPARKGRIKVFVHGVYPDEFHSTPEFLPWAEPAMPLFGGAYTSENGTSGETGITSVPKVGATVWVFFEAGDGMKPIYCFGVQAGDGWLSEHESQHCIKTDNFSLVIDEAPDHPNSTNKYDTNTSKQGSVANKVTKDVAARVKLNITGNVDIVIDGDLNFKVTGNTYREFGGNVYDTIVGNHFLKQYGDANWSRNGSTYFHSGNTAKYNYAKSVVYAHNDRCAFDVTKTLTSQIGENRRTIIGGYDSVMATGRDDIITGNYQLSTIGQFIQSTCGSYTSSIQGDKTETITASASGTGAYTLSCVTYDQYSMMSSQYAVINSIMAVYNSELAVINSATAVYNSHTSAIRAKLSLFEYNIAMTVNDLYSIHLSEVGYASTVGGGNYGSYGYYCQTYGGGCGLAPAP